MLDRTIAPPIYPVQYEAFQQSELYHLKNGAPLYFINAGSQELVGIEVVFSNPAAGFKPGLIGVVFKMLQEGTLHKTAHQISEEISFYGAFLEINANAERSSVSIYCLNKYLKEVLAIVKEILTEPSFPEKEFKNLIAVSKNNIQVNLLKTAHLATMKFKSLLFGEFHPYGFTLGDEHLNNIKLEDLAAHYEQFIKGAYFEIIAAGFLNQDAIRLIDQSLGSIPIQHSKATISFTSNQVVLPGRYFVKKEDSNQNSIRIGARSINRRHEDYFALRITTEILGGYFGSRLMKNIREEKGLTYGIYAQLVPMKDEAYFAIGSDLNAENTELALTEIFNEIELLKKEPVDEMELETVKNYMMGQFVGSLTTPFSLSEKFKTIHFAGLDYGYYQAYFKAIEQISAAKVQQMAQKYWNKEDFVISIAGS